MGLTCRAIEFRRRTSAADAPPVLETINADFPAGQISWIGGPTGAGKSTLLHLLAGLLRPFKGVIMADGQPVSRWLAAHRDRWRRQVGIIFQQGHLVTDLTVLENVMLPLIPCATGFTALRRRGRQILEQVDLADRAGRKVAALSGGERQRAAAARALVVAPRFLLADEPFAHQDAAHARRLQSLFRAEAQKGATVIITAHKATLPDRRDIDRHWELNHGRLQEVSCPSTPC
jgi:ABC-type lipoprotein export system ATPase subunit